MVSTFPITSSDIVGRTCQELAGLGSEIRKMYLLGQERKRLQPDFDLIDLSLGNPDLEPPPEVQQALLDLVTENSPGMHRYMDNAGYPEVRSFLAQSLTESEKTPIAPDSVFLTCGAAGALQIVLRTLIDPGQEVIIFAPYFSEYIPYTRNIGALPVVVTCDDGHCPRARDLERALTERTRVVILNSPNNPTGVVYPPALLQDMALVIERHNAKSTIKVHVISDEPYARLLFKGVTCASFLALFETGWLVRSHSKDLGLAGERIGYIAVGPRLSLPETLPALRNAARALGFVNAPALMQRLLPRVFSARVDVDEYERRVDLFIAILASGGIDCVRPGGAFFVFPRSPLANDRAFCQLLLEAGVLCVPGSGFGTPGYFRCSLTQPLEFVRTAAERIISCAKCLEFERK